MFESLVVFDGYFVVVIKGKILEVYGFEVFMLVVSLEEL